MKEADVKFSKEDGTLQEMCADQHEIGRPQTFKRAREFAGNLRIICAFFIPMLISRDKMLINHTNERDFLTYLLTSKSLLR